MTSSAKAIASLSALTEVQVETLGLHDAVAKNAITLQSALKIRKEEGIQRGTYYRILSQAKKNIKESLFTVAIGVQFGLLKTEDVQKLITSVSMVPTEVDPDRLPEILGLMNALADRIVML